MKSMIKRNWFLLVLGVLFLLPNSARANDYLEHQGHYTVMSMGNGVLRFTIPIWVYGAVNDYYLEGNNNFSSNDDSYIWYSTSANAGRGASSVHRIASVSARRYGTNDSDSDEGQGFIYIHEGSAIIQSTYNGEKIVLQAGDGTYWTGWSRHMSFKRKNDDDHKRITYITFDWYPPESLQGQDFYWGVSANIYKKSSGESSYKKWWAWPEKYQGGDIPQSPELYDPYIYAMDASGKTGYGCAATQYTVYQEPISYHTSLNSTEVVTTKRSDQIIVPTCDTVQRFFSATFNVYTDKAAGQKQLLKTNEIHIPAYHRIYHFNSEEMTDDKGSATGKVKLSWEIAYPSAKELVENDVFELQRSTNADFENAQTINVQAMFTDTAIYSYEDDVLLALGADTTALQEEKKYQSVSRTAVAKDQNGNPYAEYDVTIRSNKVMTPGQHVYYRVRRASASVWGWQHDFAASDTLVRNDYLAPLAAEQPNYTLDPDYANNRKVHFTFKLDNSIVAPTTEPISECGWSCRLKRIVTENIPIRVKMEPWSPYQTPQPENYRVYITYRRPEKSQEDTVHLSFTALRKYVSAVFPSSATNVVLHVVDKASGRSLGTNQANEADPYVKTIVLNTQWSTSSTHHVEFSYDANYYNQLRDSMAKANPLNQDSVKNVLYQELQAKVASMAEEGKVRCNWDENALLYLQRKLVETGETTETAIPADSIVRQEDGSWLVHMTDVANRACAHYEYSIRLDQTNSVLKVMRADDLLPKAIQGPDVYYNEAARVEELTAQQGDDRYGVLLTWKHSAGGVDKYLIGRRDEGSTVDFADLTTTEDDNYRDLDATPGHHYEYRVTATYSCNGTTTQHSATAVGWRSPYGLISGRVHYSDGTACPGVTVKLTASGVDVEAVTDLNGQYAFDSLLYGAGTDYTVMPTGQNIEFRFNNTTSPMASVTLSANTPVAEAIEFDNITAVRFSGRVLYKNSSIPVRDAHLLLNGHVVQTAGGVLHTDVAGNFELRVPKGSAFTLQAAKEGHGFAGDGFVRINDSKELTLDAPLDGVLIWDTTKVRLAGRVVGGLNQAQKPLGFGLSSNNLGDDIQLVLELEGDNTSYIVRVPDDLNKDTLNYRVPHVTFPLANGALNADTVGFTDMHLQRKRIIVNPDPLTGEFCADLFPVRYKIVQATATGYATLFANGKTSEVIDLSDAAHRLDSAVVDNYVARWNERFNITYRSPISISCQQLRYGMLEDFYGEKAVTRQNIKNEMVSIPLAQRDKSGEYAYTFGVPVFASGEYRFRVTAHEDYYYNNQKSSAKHEEVRIKGGTLKVYNGMYDAGNTQMETMPLNAEGQVDITVPIDYVSFLKTGESALRVLDLSVESEGQYVEYQALKAYVMGNRVKGNDFLVSKTAAITLLDVLRDPPGSKSYAFIESGTTYNYDYTFDFKGTFGLQIGANYGTGNTINLGTWSGVGGGLYSGYTMSHSANNSYALPITSSVKYNHAGSYSFTTNQRIETGSDVYHVGAEGDIYIGATQSVYFGLLDAVRPIDSVTYASIAAQLVDSVGALGTSRVVAQGTDSLNHPYYLVIGEETEAGTYVDGSFAYSQDFIFNSILPRLIQERDALLLTGDSATVQSIADARNKMVYWSKVAPEDSTFALTNYTKLYPNGKQSEWIDIDDVALYNQQIKNWINLIRENEQTKIGVIYGVNADLVGNYSVSNGVKESHSETYNYSSTISYRWDYPAISPKTNLNLLGSSMAKFADDASRATLRQLANIVDMWADDGDGAGGHAGKDPYMIDVRMPEAEWKFSITPLLDFDFSRDPKKTNSKRKSAGFVLETDEYSYMNVTVSRMREEDNAYNEDSEAEREFVDNGNDYSGRDYLYGSYVYMLNGGASKCPWEEPEEAIFYEQGGQPVLLSKGTLNLENPKVDINVHERSDVPHDKPAIFNLRLTNELEQDIAVGPFAFYLKLDEISNPKGAKIFIDGQALTGDPRPIWLRPGQIVNKTMEVYAGEDYDYENLSVMFISTCNVGAVSKATFSVHYMPVSCPVNIATPHDKWVMNTLSPRDSTGYYMPVVIDGFDVNYKEFDHIELQYKLSKQSDDGWVNLCSYYASDSLYQAASGTKAMISGGRISDIRFYGERDPMEQQYDLRAVSFCRHGSSFLTRSSAVLTGVKDTRPPVLFGYPQPANGILGVGDNLQLRFSEPIAGNYLDADNNFQLIGSTNRTGITAGTSLYFDAESDAVAQSQVKRSLAHKSFSIDLMVNPSEAGKNNTFFVHSDEVNRQLLIFGIDDMNRLYLDLMPVNGAPGWTLRSLPLEPITAFTRVIVTYNHTTKAVRFFAGTKEMTNPEENSLPDDFVYAGYSPFSFGEDYTGNMLEARVWTKALTPEEVANTHMRYLTGYERELLAYYRFNEGRGTTVTDYANGATLSIDHALWTTPRGISLRLTEDNPVQLDHRYLSRSAVQDETLMFWFQLSDAQGGNLFSAGRIENDSITAGFALRVEGGNLVLHNDAQSSLINRPLAYGQWHHLVLSVNRTYNNASLFLNGEMVLSMAATELCAISGQMFFGGFNGHVDEFAIFEQALPSSLAEAFDYISPSGDEMGLMAFLPFQETKENESGILELVFSPNDQRVFRDANGNVVPKVLPLIIGQDIDQFNLLPDGSAFAPTRVQGPLTKMNFTWTYDQSELLINLKMADSEVNKQNMYITVRNVEDLNGNPMASPVTWTAYMDRNSLKWDVRELVVEREYNDLASSKYVDEVQFTNHSGSRHQFTVESLPDWLTVSPSYGSVDPTGYKTLRFTFADNLAVGVYSDVVYLSDENGLSEPLFVEYTVKASCPYDAVDENQYPLNMSVCGQVLVEGKYDTNPNDRVIAIYRSECVGMATIDFNEQRNTSKVHLSVFGNEQMMNKELNFLLWQSSTGKVLALTPSRKIIFSHGAVYGCGDESLITFTTGGSETQNITLNAGWNWISTHLAIDKAQGLITNGHLPWTEGDVIKNPATRQFSTYSDADDQFVGMLKAWDYTQMYMLYTKNGNILRLSGEELSAADRRLTLHGGGKWNALPCLYDEATPITEAMADYFDHATPGDIVKSHGHFAYFSTDKHWEGDLTALRPGEGYLMRRLGAGDVTVSFYNKASSAPQKVNEPMVHARMGHSATNMTLIARVDIQEYRNTDMPSLRAYIGSDLVGVATPLAIGTERYYFLTVSSDAEGSELRFETEEGVALMPVDLSSSRHAVIPILYQADSHYGSLKAPVVLQPADHRPYKIIENNHVLIIRNNEKYDLTGKKL